MIVRAVAAEDRKQWGPLWAGYNSFYGRTLPEQITDVTCDNTGTQASIFGNATVDGTGSHPFQIDVQDNGEPGKGRDHYRMRIPDIGYDSGDHILRGGNVQIH